MASLRRKLSEGTAEADAAFDENRRKRDQASEVNAKDAVSEC